MQLDREEIIKALELCKTPAASDCNACGYKGKGIKNGIYVGCTNRLIADALSLIKELTEENERLRVELEQRPPRLVITKLQKGNNDENSKDTVTLQEREADHHI